MKKTRLLVLISVFLQSIKYFSEMGRDRYLILVAGGSGTRMGGRLPKQFIEIRGKAVLHHTIDRFVAAVPDIRVVTVLPDTWKQAWSDYCLVHNVTCSQRLVSGGITRFHSVKIALEKVPAGALVAVHDGVRPLVSVGMIRRLFDEAEVFPAVVPVVPVVDTLKVLGRETDASGKTVLVPLPGEKADRSRLFAAQTPQIFWSEVLKEAYTQPYSTDFTDDASVAESYGTDIKYPEGERYNIKLTTPDDMVVAEALMG